MEWVTLEPRKCTVASCTKILTADSLLPTKREMRPLNKTRINQLGVIYFFMFWNAALSCYKQQQPLSIRG